MHGNLLEYLNWSNLYVEKNEKTLAGPSTTACLAGQKTQMEVFMMNCEYGVTRVNVACMEICWNVCTETGLNWRTSCFAMKIVNVTSARKKQFNK